MKIRTMLAALVASILFSWGTAEAAPADGVPSPDEILALTDGATSPEGPSSPSSPSSPSGTPGPPAATAGNPSRPIVETGDDCPDDPTKAEPGHRPIFEICPISIVAARACGSITYPKSISSGNNCPKCFPTCGGKLKIGGQINNGCCASMVCVKVCYPCCNPPRTLGPQKLKVCGSNKPGSPGYWGPNSPAGGGCFGGCNVTGCAVIVVQPLCSVSGKPVGPVQKYKAKVGAPKRICPICP